MTITPRNLAAAALILGAASAAPASQPTDVAPAAPDYSKCTTSKFIPFTNPEKNFGGTNNIKYQMAGSDTVYSAALDTGSNGFKVYPEQIPDWENIVKDSSKVKPAHIYYVSSYNLLTGWHYNTTVRLPDAGMETTDVQVFVQTWAGHCTKFNTLPPEQQQTTHSCPGVPESAPSTEFTPPSKPRNGYMGIGFSRRKWADGTGMANTKGSPLLNIGKIDGKAVSNYCQGYAFTDKGIDVGITAEVAKGYKTIKLLQNNPEPGDWHWIQPPVYYKFGKGDWRKTDLLVDTGIDYMLINWVPSDYAGNDSLGPPTSDENPQHHMAAGTPVSVRVGDQKTTLFEYEFKARVRAKKGETPPADDKTTLYPPEVVVTVQDGKPNEPELMNTGSKLLRGNDMLIDNTQGWYGLRARKPSGTA